MNTPRPGWQKGTGAKGKVGKAFSKENFPDGRKDFKAEEES